MIGDHDQPYAPVPPIAYKLAAVLPLSNEVWAELADRPGDLYRAYWRRREFNQRRHPATIWPTFRPIRWLP